VPQPTIANGLVIYNHDYDNPELLAVKLGGGTGDVTDSHVVWRIKRGAPSTPTPLLIGDDLYFVSDKGIASCVDSRTGEVRWTERLGGGFSASPIYANGHVLFLNEEGLATWVKPGHEFAMAGENQLPGRTLATPAFADGAMYLRTDEFLYKFAE
jgi:outer membrane protein assembly factor BamB